MKILFQIAVEYHLRMFLERLANEVSTQTL